MRSDAPLLAGVELGGTKCVCTLGDAEGRVVEEVRLSTRDAPATIADIEAVLDRWRDGPGFAAIGIASFGPVELNRGHPRYGFVTSTAKPGWRDTDLARRIAARYGVPTGFDTDVNGAALAEGRWGAARGIADHAYVTVGTGVGVGLVVAGRPIGGFTHAEVGHVRVQRLPGDDWPGACPFHGGCVEGLASGSAVAARLGVSGDAVGSDHPVWPLVAHALGQLLHVLVLTAAPRRILMGGGVMDAQPGLFPMIRRELADSLAGYVVDRRLAEDLDTYVVPPALGGRAGPMGSLVLAGEALAGGR